MTEQEIKDGAPSGASHYRKFSHIVRYIKLKDGAWWYWGGEFWILANLQNEFQKASFKFKPL